MTFSEKIFGKKKKEVIDNDDSHRKFNLKNRSFDKSELFNKDHDNSKNEEFELENFNEKNQNISDELTEEIIDNLDNEKLKSILKAKCRIINSLDQAIKLLNKDFTKEKESNDELKTIIRLQKKEIQRNNKFILELKNEINIWREKVNNFRTSELEKIKINKPSNYFESTEKKEEKMQITDFKDNKILENQFIGDSEVSFSSNLENNNISKKWFSEEKHITINLDDLELKFSKINDEESRKMNFMQKKEFKFIDFLIYNVSNSSLEISDLQIDSTERMMIILNFMISKTIRFNC